MHKNWIRPRVCHRGFLLLKVIAMGYFDGYSYQLTKWGNDIIDWFKGLPGKISGLWRDYTGQTTNQQTINANVDAADVAWQRQLEMFNLQNEYNSPAAQMQRARDAGLNPSLIYGQPISEAASPSGVPQASIGGLISPTGAYSNLINFTADAMLKRSQSRLLDEQAESERFMRQARYDNLVSTTQLNMGRIDDLLSQIQRRVHENGLTDAQKDNISFSQLMEKQRLSIDWKRLANETDMTKSQVDKLHAEYEELLARAKVTQREFDEMCWTYAIRYSSLGAQYQLTKEQIEVAKKTAAKLGHEDDRLLQVLNSSNPQETFMSYVQSAMDGKYGKAGRIAAFVGYGVSQALSSVTDVISSGAQVVRVADQ